MDGAPSNSTPEQLEQNVDAIRDDLGDLVGELDRRRHRATRPLLIGAAVIGGLLIAGGVAFFIRDRRRRPTRLGMLRQAIRTP
ncbi:MAG TPA: hypothetical protein VGL59_12345 [Polyangia bacterium]|jgi:outer membrane murein-binding lipoprotein Lpp